MNAVANHENKKFSERLIYKTGFVNRELFDNEYIARLLSVCKKVKSSLSFAAVVTSKKAVNHVHVSPSVTRSDNRGQQPKMLGRRNAVQYGKRWHHNKVVKRSSGSGCHQGVSHMGGDVCAFVKSKGKQSLICKDDHVERFVHKNRFQPLVQDDADSIEMKCQSSVSTCESTDCQVGVSPVALLVKDGSKSVKGKPAKPSNCSKLAVNSKYLKSEKSSENTVRKGLPGLNAINTIRDDDMIVSTCENPSGNANSATDRSLCGSSIVKTVDIEGNDQLMDNSYKSTVVKMKQVPDTIADKYALELQTSMKKDKLKVARQAPDNTLCIAQNVPLFGFIPIYGIKNHVVDKCHNIECNDILQLHKMLRKDGRHNDEGLQIPVPTKLNYKVWAGYFESTGTGSCLCLLNSDSHWTSTEIVLLLLMI